MAQAAFKTKARSKDKIGTEESRLQPVYSGTGTTPSYTVTKEIGYVGFDDSTTLGAIGSQKVLDFATSGTTYGETAVPEMVEVINKGETSVIVSCLYESYTGETISSDSRALQVLVKPRESFYPPIQAIVNVIGSGGTSGNTQMLEGTKADNAAPNSSMYTDSTADLYDGSLNAVETQVFLEAWSSPANNATNFFRVGDLIRLNNEVMEVTGFGDLSDLANTYLTVIRGVYGSDAVDTHSDDDAIRFPFFNAYHDFDKYSVVQTDAGGKFKCTNLFGNGRAATGASGITPSSVCVKFYDAGYQELGLSGITASTESGLAVSTIYGFDITVDGSGLIDSNSCRFTTSSNTKWGGNDGVIRKIQDMLDTLYYTSGNLLNEKVIVSIVNGDIRFTSGQHLSTSAILLATGSVGMDTATTPFGAGRVPAIGDIMAPVPARLPDDTIRDKVTYEESPNSEVLSYDDGYGNLIGGRISGGIINYETGTIDFRGPANAEFVITALYNSPFSGKKKPSSETTIDQVNSLSAIHANTPNQRFKAQVEVKVY